MGSNAGVDLAQLREEDANNTIFELDSKSVVDSFLKLEKGSTKVHLIVLKCR